jgi:hypothetical protein
LVSLHHEANDSVLNLAVVQVHTDFVADLKFALWVLIIELPWAAVNGGTGETSEDSSVRAAWQSNKCGHFRGFLAVAIFPSELSTSA